MVRYCPAEDHSTPKESQALVMRITMPGGGSRSSNELFSAMKFTTIFHWWVNSIVFRLTFMLYSWMEYQSGILARAEMILLFAHELA